MRRRNFIASVLGFAASVYCPAVAGDVLVVPDSSWHRLEQVVGEWKCATRYRMVDAETCELDWYHIEEYDVRGTLVVHPIADPPWLTFKTGWLSPEFVMEKPNATP